MTEGVRCGRILESPPQAQHNAQPSGSRRRPWCCPRKGMGQHRATVFTTLAITHLLVTTHVPGWQVCIQSRYR